MRKLILALSVAMVAAQPPETRRENFKEVLHGVEVADPYRWLEDQEAAETRQWIDAQNRYSASMLDALPGRAAIQRRLDELTREATQGMPRRRGDYYYTPRRAEGAQVTILYRRPVKGGAEEAIFDPARFSSESHTTASFLAASNDGRILAYALRRGGEDETEIRFRDVTNGKDLETKIPRHLNRGFALREDGKGCYYTNHDRERGPRIRYLDLASGQEKLIFGEGFSPAQFISPGLLDSDRYLLITASQGWASNDLYWMDLKKDAAPRALVKGVAAHFNAIDGGDRLLIHTDWNAPRYRLLTALYGKPEQKNWKEIVAEDSDPLQDVTPAGGRLFLEYLHNVTSRIAIHALDGRKLGEVTLPGLGTASFAGQPEERTAYFTYTTFSTPATILEYDTESGQQKPYFRSLPNWDATAYEVRQVWATSKDGTKVPMFVAHRKGVKPDGNLPVVLNGYGGFNVSLLPRFSTMAAVWMEQGGVWAQANLRGGSEFGEAWHRSGMMANKQNVFDDFIASAEWLIGNGYTSPKRLAIMGASNGGLLVGAALTQRPDLYRAVVCSYPDLDMVGYWRFKNNNKPALLEYGDASKPDEFRFLLKYSPYQNVKEGTKYPAVLLTSGDRDTRVPPLQARKMTARLQAASTSGLPVLLHYDTEAGHVGVSTRTQALEAPVRNLAFLFWQLGVNVGVPGSGLAQHPFLYCGEWQNRSVLQQAMHVVRDGKVVWSYTNPHRGELGDCTRLSNGNILFSRQFGASEVTADKRIVWNYNGPEGTEIHTTYPIGAERVLIMQNGDPAKLLVIEKATNRVEKEIVLATRNPKGVHGQFRHIRATKAGTFLVAHMDLGKVVEYSGEGKEIWSTPAPSAWAAVRLANGNTLISGNQLGYVREVNSRGETVWEINKGDLPGYPLYTVQEVTRLANGNTLINNWAGNLPMDQWASTFQLIEVTPDKKVVWALREWTTLGPASSTQLLDEPGVPEKGDLQR